MQTSLIVKIMSSPKNTTKGFKAQHELIVIDVGDSIKFNETSFLITRQDGTEIYRDVPGFVYVMNAEGITISTFDATPVVETK